MDRHSYPDRNQYAREWRSWCCCVCTKSRSWQIWTQTCKTFQSLALRKFVNLEAWNSARGLQTACRCWRLCMMHLIYLVSFHACRFKVIKLITLLWGAVRQYLQAPLQLSDLAWGRLSIPLHPTETMVRTWCAYSPCRHGVLTFANHASGMSGSRSLQRRHSEGQRSEAHPLTQPEHLAYHRGSWSETPAVHWYWLPGKICCDFILAYPDPAKVLQEAIAP